MNNPELVELNFSLYVDNRFSLEEANKIAEHIGEGFKTLKSFEKTEVEVALGIACLNAGYQVHVSLEDDPEGPAIKVIMAGAQA